MDTAPEQLEIVFYTGPFTLNLTSLTVMGLIFDRIHFPNVRIPYGDFDPGWVESEVRRIEATGLRDYDTWMLLQLLRCSLHPELAEFCNFTATKDQVFGGDEMKRAAGLVSTLSDRMFGSPKPGFTPIFTPGHNKGLPYSATIDYPGMFYYQANAIQYAGDRGLPLFNDDTRFPIPAVAGIDVKNNAKVLATIMALECVNLVLPSMGALQPAQIVEAREDLKSFVGPFRRSLLGLAGKLNASIQSTSDYNEIKQAAEFVAQTEVYPALAEFRGELERAQHRSWIPRAWELAKQVPAMVVAYSSGADWVAIQNTIAGFGSWFIAGISEDKPRSGLHYLLKLQDRVGGQSKP